MGGVYGLAGNKYRYTNSAVCCNLLLLFAATVVICYIALVSSTLSFLTVSVAAATKANSSNCSGFYNNQYDRCLQFYASSIRQP